MIFFRFNFWRRLCRDERGVTGIKCGVVASLVAMALVSSL